jgi:hypothetical protein
LYYLCLPFRIAQGVLMLCLQLLAKQQQRSGQAECAVNWLILTRIARSPQRSGMKTAAEWHVPALPDQPGGSDAQSSGPGHQKKNIDIRTGRMPGGVVDPCWHCDISWKTWLKNSTRSEYGCLLFIPPRKTDYLKIPHTCIYQPLVVIVYGLKHKLDYLCLLFRISQGHLMLSLQILETDRIIEEKVIKNCEDRPNPRQVVAPHMNREQNKHR